MIRRLIILLLIVGCDNSTSPKPEDCAGVAGGTNICGCNETTALNYDSTATFNDGSCEFDTTAPTVVITFPVNNSILDSITTIKADVADNNDIISVLFLIDGAEAYADSTAPYEYVWDVCMRGTDNHAVLVTAEDSSGNIGQSGLSTFTLNASYDCEDVCGGGALEDNCGVCDIDTSNDNTTCEQDCAGVWGGDAVLSGCDNICNSTAVEDCAGVCSGDAVEDVCGNCFNENENYTQGDMVLSWPIDCIPGNDCDLGHADINNDNLTYNCTSPGYMGHQGTDIGITWEQMDSGVDVYAAASGEVIWVFDGQYDRCPNANESDCQNPEVCTQLGPYCGTGDCCCYWCFAGGNVVIILHNEIDNVFATRYDHLKKNSILINEGDIVIKGQKIAEVGSAGASSGPHLHFEVWGTGFYELTEPWSGSCGPNYANYLWECNPPWSR